MKAIDEMAPAFATRRQWRAFGVIVALVLLIPTILRHLRVPTHAQRMATLPVRAGPIAFLHHQIYEDNSDIDIAFVGDSVIWNGVDTPAVAAALEKAVGHAARVLTLGWNWHGDVLTYYVLRDLLARRRVDTLVMRLPRDIDRVRAPHAQSYRFFAGWDDPVLPTLPLSDQLALYGIEMTGSLRNLLSLLRPDRLGPPESGTLGAFLAELGPNSGPFTHIDVPSHHHPPGNVLSTFAGSTALKWGGEAAPKSYAWKYASAIHALLEEHGVNTAFIRFPVSSEVHNGPLGCDKMWMEIFGKDTAVLAVKPQDLFAGFSDESLTQLYYDPTHFNRNGSAYFTTVLVPALLELWLNAQHLR